MTVGERILKRRTELGVGQTELADKVGVSKQTLYKYENNIVTNIPLEKIELIAAYLSISPAVLMGWEAIAYPPANEREKFMRLRAYYEKLSDLTPEHENQILEFIDMFYEKDKKED